MDYLWIGAGIAALWLLNKVVLAPVRHLAFNVIIGLIALYFVNHFGAVIGLHARMVRRAPPSVPDEGRRPRGSRTHSKALSGLL